MIESKHHFVIYPMFKNLTRFLLKKNFSKIETDGVFEDKGTPVLVIANHISWWDGFWIMYINLQIIHRKFHFMMLEEQLKKHWYFRYSGAYSIRKKSRGTIESLNYTTGLLNDSSNMVLMFPQGIINSLYNSDIRFEQGIQRIIEKSRDDLQVLFIAIFPDYLSKPKPCLFIYLKPFYAKYFKQRSVESEYRYFYKNSLNKQKTIMS